MRSCSLFALRNVIIQHRHAHRLTHTYTLSDTNTGTLHLISEDHWYQPMHLTSVFPEEQGGGRGGGGGGETSGKPCPLLLSSQTQRQTLSPNPHKHKVKRLANAQCPSGHTVYKCFPHCNLTKVFCVRHDNPCHDLGDSECAWLVITQRDQ